MKIIVCMYMCLIINVCLFLGTLQAMSSSEFPFENVVASASHDGHDPLISSKHSEEVHDHACTLNSYLFIF